ncbi:glycine dehydrogenase (decarboxylating) alpha subunit /glycine dehydrogenase (decarboxylating) beta subunit [Motilibacter rhizosphaerae]|uniref:Glycine dehydrogenase (decarboxylating) n=1 Tax=Motilibacter rhizosphaerae TaxID=598652 RepID=A0A4V2F2V4_9ACTN|nr:aminomethyl-transferring glycine dehydrogenase [Motilibacter rhizosphaerae]RZS80204.1 glycine dehydrogenase (decarboxylating) alpha subunit /glycine dehydrogenase (decarboxylating) beta subunit [Motilibacter rhizosphaerae]
MTSPFTARHIGPDPVEQQKMLQRLGYDSLEALLDAAVPAGIRSTAELDLPLPASEEEATAELRALAARNAVRVPMIGLGYFRCLTPAVVRRNVLEDPSWYTAYTPYQPEISQGRLEALFTFQTLVSDLTALPVAGASLLDEATAAAEALTMAARVARGAAKGGAFVVDADTHPQTLALLTGRAEPLGIPLVVRDVVREGLPDGPVLGVLLSYPTSSGAVHDLRALAAEVHERGGLVAAATDLLALTLLTPPGEWGADVAVGSAQRFGVPLFYGGPHAGFMSVRDELARQLPGRLVGLSRDADGQPAYRLALQTREQHIRRDKATSNICTAQVLLAVVSAMYASYHGAEGLRAIAERVHGHAADLAAGLRAAGVELAADAYVDTVTAVVPGRAEQVVAAAREAGVDLRLVDADRVGVSCDETTRPEHVDAVLAAFGAARVEAAEPALPAALGRTSAYLTAPVFTDHRSETELLRYLKRLSDRDYALDRGMIPLGSCTMKLNATSELEPISWPEFADVHPFQPAEDAEGYRRLIADLEHWLAEVTGYDAVSVQPNAGASGELAGLLAIRGYHRANGDEGRDVCLVPASAHGTNAASAVLAGLRVVVVGTTDDGEVDLDDLRAKIAANEGRVAAIMVTYPSTHGVYEDTITTVCELVHEAGGQVYVDGANLNALVGIARPGAFGADVSHLNLHKTFCIPHGGGGPGVGPVAARAHLAPYLPGHPLGGERPESAPVSAAPWGSAGILPIPWMYIRMMGAEGLRRATEVAVLSANYVAARLRDSYPVLYSGHDGLVAHECILDLRPLTKETGITVDDVAKRLIDYGFHAPTMSFPVAGTLMVEPTESEDLREIDRFCDAMIAIRQEAAAVAAGRWPAGDNPLARAPHPAYLLAEEWDRAYTRKEAVYPEGVDRAAKYWPPVSRIDAAWGDRNLVCACPPIEAYED